MLALSLTLALAAAPEGDPQARAAAQRGLDYLGKVAVQWQEDHKCYGCHVQGVTMEALTVGKSHQYTVPDGVMSKIMFGMTDISGGAHGPDGLTVGEGASLLASAKSFGGAAFAHYDERVGPKLRKELEKTATELLEYQDKDGSITPSYDALPIVAGRVQATTQAIITWRQANARTADTRWLVPIRKAEEWLTLHAKRMSDEGGALQDLDYAIIGIHAAGAGSGDKLIAALARVVEKHQNDDGGFGYNMKEASNAFATGQALYALRLAGRSDGDRIVKRGTTWLLQHQQTDGGWGGAGFAKAEAMWAVLGLVSMDMISVDLVGLVDGQHVDGNIPLTITAADNTGKKVKKLEIVLDDNVIASGSEAKLATAFDATKLEKGPHLVDVVATGETGKQSRRRFVVYAGDAWLHEVGSRFENDKTILGFRNIAPDVMKAQVKVRILDDKKKEIENATIKASEGPMSWAYAGKQGGRLTAQLSLVDKEGKVRETQEVVFTHDTYEAQKARFAEVSGQVSIDDGEEAANTVVELVDKDGNVMQSTRTTRSGQYRFQNVDDGKYKVRVKKKGFKDWEANLDAKKAAESAAPAAALERH
jgi:hypothetical protein